MPTNRPFFANFFAAFRAHTAISKASTTSSVSTTTTQTTTFSPPTLTSARSMATKSPSQGATTAAVQAANHLSHTRHPSAIPISKSPTASMSPSASRSPPARSPPSNFGRPQRRGSDSSSEGGFRDALGGEKWYVGGMTATGEERYYRLGMVRKERSGDRLSMDRLSL
ncbi:hypothetical protein P7C71_g2336, partial [Lecanoromycetidae sp. Uapishka_2]